MQQISPCNFNSSFLESEDFYLVAPPVEEHGVPEAWPALEKFGTRYTRG